MSDETAKERLTKAVLEEMRENFDVLSGDLAIAKIELEQARMQLAACSAAALGNTPAAVKERLDRDHPYWSATYGDVCRAVDSEMAMRENYRVLSETALERQNAARMVAFKQAIALVDGYDTYIAAQLKKWVEEQHGEIKS